MYQPKQVIFSLQLLICSLSFGQEWAEIGATWHYNHYIDLWNGNYHYSVFTIDGEQMVGGQMCKHINRSTSFVQWKSDQYEYTYYSNDSVYYWDSDSSVFRMLYDFGAVQGDTWIYPFNGQELQHPGDRDSVITYVDSTDIININGHNLKRLFVHYALVNFEQPDYNPILNGQENSEIIEFIGDINFMFNTFTIDELIFDDPMPYGLRCFEDTTIGFYDFDIVDSCDWAAFASIDETDIPVIMVYPNPVIKELNVSYPNFDGQLSFTIYGIDGKRMLDGVKMDLPAKIDLDKLEPGVYIIYLNSGFNEMYFKILKI